MHEQSKQDPQNSKDTTCSMPKRLAAMFYDSMLLASLFFLVTLILLFFTKGAAIDSENISYHFFLLFIVYGYFVWHWVHGGQTLGMHAWKIQLIRDDKGLMTYTDATIRFCLAFISIITFGAGFFWVLFDKKNLSFHDRFSNTHLVQLKK